MSVQRTFRLIPESLAKPDKTPAPPMTSKQVKKAHKAANKQPRLSRMEQRKLELAEQERIRKELEKERTAARARAARERKKAKEEAQRVAKRRSGKPLVDVRPSQDTISRFLKGNGSGRKRDSQGRAVQAMETVTEEQESRETTISESESAVAHDTDDSNDNDGHPSPDIFLHEPGSPSRQREERPSLDKSPPQDDPDPCQGDGDDLEPNYDTTGSHNAKNKQDQERGGDTHDRASPPDERVTVQSDLDELDTDIDLLLGADTSFHGPKISEKKEAEIEDLPKREDSGSSKSRQTLEPACMRRDQDSAVDEFDDDNEQALGAAMNQNLPAIPQRSPTDHELEKPARPPRLGPAATRKQLSSFMEDDLDDDILAQLDIPNDAQPERANQWRTAETESTPDIAKKQSANPDLPLYAADLSRRDDAPRWQQPPLSTQDVLLNHDDYFPSPSQQERELASDMYLETPAPALQFQPKYASEAPSEAVHKSPEGEPPRKRFFTASGSNQLLSLAVHRSRRSAALDDIRQHERERVDAGVLQARRQPLMKSAEQRRNIPPKSSPATRTQRNPPAKAAMGNLGCSNTSWKSGLADMPPIDTPSKPPRPVAGDPRPSKAVPQLPSSLPGEEDADKENVPCPALADIPVGSSQESEFGGLWMDEMARDLASDDWNMLVGV